MIERGPVDVVVLACGEPRFDGSILSELEKQASAGTIRVLDAMVLACNEDGTRWRVDLDDLPAADKAALGFLHEGGRGLFDGGDAQVLGEGMVPGSAIVALAIEHTWAVALVNAIHDQGAQVALNYRVPAPIVDEAFASLASS